MTMHHLGRRLGLVLSAVCLTLAHRADLLAEQATVVQAAFGECEITPEITAERPVWLAGYGQARQATGVHDPLMARAVLLYDGQFRLAMVSVDLVGLQLPIVDQIRQRLPDYDFVLVGSTHNHEGPDVVGIWGPSPLKSGVDPNYLQRVEDRVVELVQATGKRLQPARVRFGSAEDPSLVHDSRLPRVKDGTVRTLLFETPGGRNTLGALVQWSCHPEAMGPRNTLVTADFPAGLVERLSGQIKAPVVLFTGAVGGLMTPPGVVSSSAGEVLAEGDFAHALRYGHLVADLAGKAIRESAPIQAAPLAVHTERLALPVDNPLYRTAWAAGVLNRPAYAWRGDSQTLGPRIRLPLPGDMAVQTEVACLSLGELRVVCVPGEIYPELVYGGVPDPAEPGVDFPDAPIEPAVAAMLGEAKWLLIGLANDEIGYIIPRRQWDRKAPFAYGRSSSQYGEMNSCSAHAAPILLQALQRVCQAATRP